MAITEVHMGQSGEQGWINTFIIAFIIQLLIHGHLVNMLRQRQNGQSFIDDIFKCISLNENILILINMSLKFVPKGQIKYIPALGQIMVWRWPLSEPMLVSYWHMYVSLWLNKWNPVEFSA